MNWMRTHRCDIRGAAMADRHYSRRRHGTPQFVPPGRCVVLMNVDRTALWVTSWPMFVKRSWCPDAWMCSLFRNESSVLSSDLIVEAVAATKFAWPDVPTDGFVTVIDPRKVRSTNPGCCYQKAGWTRLHERTKGGHVIFQLRPEDMPEAQPWIGFNEQPSLFDMEAA